MKILVSGLINIETTLLVERFPIEYSPVRYPFFGVETSVSGVGYNVAKALITLGDQVSLQALIGKDAAGSLVRNALIEASIPQAGVLPELDQTPQSVILYEPGRRRQINVDLKDIQERAYPEELFERALEDCSLAVLGNINFSRPFLHKARRLGKLVATDVHAISNLDDDYNRDFMAAADILFMSDELLPCSPEEWARQVMDRYQNEIIVIGLGSRGALLAERRSRAFERFPAVQVREVVNTIGAGDALFSCFLHYYAKSGDPRTSIRRAVIFAGYKIGEKGAAEGFLTEDELEGIVESNFY